MKPTPRVTALAGIAGFVPTSLLAVARQPAPESLPVPEDEVAGVHFPHTAEDHLAAAADYTRKAEERRKEADLHRRMLAAYEGLARNLATQPAPRERGMPFPSEKRAKPSKDPVAEYRGHCQTLHARRRDAGRRGRQARRVAPGLGARAS